eukprot:gene2858-3903_t
MSSPTAPQHSFGTPDELRAWFESHHATASELWLVYWKKGSGQPSVTWPESVDEALCFGWIDGVRKRLDDERYVIRFTPRRANSHWSAVNLQRIQVLAAEGRLHAAGHKAHDTRNPERAGLASYEQRLGELQAIFKDLMSFGFGGAFGPRGIRLSPKRRMP